MTGCVAVTDDGCVAITNAGCVAITDDGCVAITDDGCVAITDAGLTGGTCRREPAGPTACQAWGLGYAQDTRNTHVLHLRHH